MCNLQVETFTLPPDDGYPLFITANRYRREDAVPKGVIDKRRVEGSVVSERGLTLIFLHSTSFHKETWEACLETLFRIDQSSLSGRGSSLIREAWSVESPNHGDSATLNWEALQRPPFSNEFGCEGYAKAVHRFMTKGPVRFHERELVGVGHSLGANTILLLQSYSPSFPFKSLVIVEPMVSPGGDKLFEPLRTRLVRMSQNRRETWSSLDEARRWLPSPARSKRRKDGMKEWDERVVEAFLKHGIRPGNPGFGETAKFTLACPKEQEIVMYRDKRGSQAPVEVLDRISFSLPIHLILGEVKDYVPGQIHDALTAPAPGRRFASVRTLPRVGHLVPQEKPDELAEAIARILQVREPRICKL